MGVAFHNAGASGPSAEAEFVKPDALGETVEDKPQKQEKPPKQEVKVSYQREILKHELLDGDVRLLRKGKHSGYFDVFLSALFAFAASVVQGIERAFITVPQRVPASVNPYDLLVIVTPIVALIVGTVFYVLWRNEKSEVDALMDDIGERPTRPGK